MFDHSPESEAFPDSQQSCIDGTTLPDIDDFDKDRPGIQTPKTPLAKRSALPQCLQDITGRMQEAAAAVGTCSSIVPAAIVGGKRDDQKRCVVQARQGSGETIRGKNERLAQKAKKVVTPPPKKRGPKKTPARAKATPTPKKVKQEKEPVVKDEPTDGGDVGKAVKQPRELSQTPHCRKSRAWHQAFAAEMVKGKGKSIAKAYQVAKAAHSAEVEAIKAETAPAKKESKKGKPENARLKQEADTDKTD